MNNFNQEMIIWLIIVLLTCLIHILFMFLLKKPKLEAMQMMEEIKGFKMFVETTEKEEFKKMTTDI